MTRGELLLKRRDIREKARTVKTVSGAVAMTFLAISSVTVSVGAINIVIRIWG